MLCFVFDMSERMSEDLSESMSKDMSDRMSEDMSERMSEDMCVRMSKDMSERMSEDCRLLPVSLLPNNLRNFLIKSNTRHHVGSSGFLHMGRQVFMNQASR